MPATTFLHKKVALRWELVECGYGRLRHPGIKLPVNNMLMLDRVTEITPTGAIWRGTVAELDIRPVVRLPLSRGGHARLPGSARSSFF